MRPSALRRLVPTLLPALVACAAAAFAAPPAAHSAVVEGEGPGRAASIEAAARAQAAHLRADRRLVGQSLVYSFAGTRPPSALLRRIRLGQAAGVILFSRNIESRAGTRAMVRRLQRVARTAPASVRAPLLVMVDQEGGAVRRLAGAPRRSAAEIGSTGRASVARAAGRAAARNLRRVGAQVNLAPVLDVARPGGEIARFGRAFGGDAGTVRRLGTAFARGLRDGGVAATAKHFPGFGAARANTDDEPVTLGLGLETLRSIDEAPYRAAVSERIELVMMSSAVYPALDGVWPAGLSRRVVRGELRGRLGFRGVTVTDALGTPGIARYGTPARVAVRAAAAGNDLLLYAGGYREGAVAAGALERALSRDALSRASLVDAAARVFELRTSLAGP